jgi:hypothetical protein
MQSPVEWVAVASQGEWGTDMLMNNVPSLAAMAQVDVIDNAVVPPPRPTPDPAATEESLRGIVDRLQKLADEQVRQKSTVEQRWIKALRSFHGHYDPTIETQLKEQNKSRAFVKITRKKANSWKGRLESLIFPTDDRNYGIQPTPVPSLTADAKRAAEEAEAAVAQANEQQALAEQQSAQGDEAGAAVAQTAAQRTVKKATDAADRAKQLDAQIAEAKKRGEAMQAVMDDQLIECSYPGEGRDAISDWVILGSGIVKGPLAADVARGQWVKKEDGFVYERSPDPAPIFKRVDPWSYFPEMAARKKGEEEFEFERHLWTRKDLRRNVKERGFDADATRRLLDNEVRDRSITDAGMSYLAELRAIDGATELLKGRFVGWEYHGPLECDELVTMLHAVGEHDLAFEYQDNPDPLAELRVIAYFCQGELLKIAPEYPLDSQESLYSLVPFEQSEGSMFGYGIPDIMEDSQASMNAGWRMALDNGGLSSGPQIVVDRDGIEPANGVWEITPRKIWWRKKGAAQVNDLFQVEDIPNKVAELMAIVETSRRFADDETALPVQSEGEMTDNPNVTATASNIMALGFNVTFRMAVKAWDDGMTVPSMRRLYDWNMQHNDRDDIKGDMKVDARGTSVLLMREMVGQVLMAVVQNHTAHPVLAAMLNPYDAYRKFLQSVNVQPDEIMVSKEEWEKRMKAQADAAGQQQNPQMVTAQMQLQRAQLESQTSLQIAQINRDTELTKLAEARNMKLDDLKTMLNIKQIETGSKERMFAAELGAEQQNADQARADGREPSGSGGFISSGSEPRP